MNFASIKYADVIVERRVAVMSAKTLSANICKCLSYLFEERAPIYIFLEYNETKLCF